MSHPRIIRDPGALRAALAGRESGLVPTMGALHAGHQALIRQAAVENELVVVTLFVNPTQFSDPADLAAYPRTVEADADLAGAASADILFAPEVETIYPPGAATRITVGGVSERWEGAARPGHFTGVATVVAILLNIGRPTRSYFGEKDYQQLAVIRRLHRDLHLPGAIVGCPTVREPDGLAYSSRNRRLSREGRRAAGSLHRALTAMRSAHADGERDVAALQGIGGRFIAAEPAAQVDHLVVVDAATLEPLEVITEGRSARILVAAIIDGVRLIDNMALEDAT